MSKDCCFASHSCSEPQPSSGSVSTHEYGATRSLVHLQSSRKYFTATGGDSHEAVFPHLDDCGIDRSYWQSDNPSDCGCVDRFPVQCPAGQSQGVLAFGHARRDRCSTEHLGERSQLRCQHHDGHRCNSRSYDVQHAGIV